MMMGLIGNKAPVLGGGLTRTDDFNRADSGSLGANWTNALNTFSIVSNAAVGQTGVNSVAFWSADNFANDQFSQATIGNNLGARGVSVRASTASGGNCYFFTINALGDGEVWKLVAGSFTQLGATITVGTGPGAVIKLTVSGTTLTPNVSGTDLATRTDSDLASGNPGLHMFNNLSTLDDWSGGLTQ